MSVELSLYKLADVLAMKLRYAAGEITGSQTGTVHTPLGLAVRFELRALKLFSADQTGVLLHVLGDLYMVVSHFPKMGGVCAFLLDGGKLSKMEGGVEGVIGKQMHLKEVLESLNGSVVQAFHFNVGWKILKLPK